MIRAQEALRRLKEGNRRFVEGTTAHTEPHVHRRQGLVGGQAPMAVILGCADSRVPAEIVFDQGLGDLFVIRVAGNVVAPSLVGSVEYATNVTGTRLVVVLGHSDCGAVQASIDELLRPNTLRSPNLRAIVDRLSPVVSPLLETELKEDRARLVAAAVRANIRASVDHLRHGSAILEELIQEDGLKVVGAEYSLDTGEVEFFEG